MSRPALAWLVLVTVLLGGCGYGLRGTLPSHLRTVAVPVFVNRTSEPGVENFITRAVIEAFSSSGRLRVVPPERADSLLEGEIVGYRVEALAFDPQANVREYRLWLTLNLEFRDLRKNTVLWRHEGIQERADFRVPGQVAVTIAREETALREAAVIIGREIVNRAVNQF
ncbi:MAG: LPS assembly lipoprotein LptE [Candidatus Methylomirabilia bacterium]